MKAVFLYDGKCLFCESLALYWKTKTDSEKIEFISFRTLNDQNLKSLHPSLTLDRCESEVQLIYKNKRYPGFFAIRQMMFWSTQYKLVAPLLYLPFVPFIGMFVLYFLKKFKS